ncbi:MAG: MAPEG family protein [Gammaproteobacteria bacterium]|nr:MAPEG family protein [Gammaproteobacteria bacterium]
MIISIPVSSVFSLCFTLLIIVLAMQVVRCRKRHKVGYGDNENIELQCAMSAHSNAVENIPLALLLLILLELNGVDQIILIILGTAFLLARIIHARGLLKSVSVSFGRTYGTLFSWLILIIMAVMNVVYAVK